jgi:hypothetical protein
VIGLLDPALLLPRQETEIEQELANIVLACKQYNIRLVALPEYWIQLWSSLGRDLETTLSAKGKQAVQALRRLGETATWQARRPTKVWRLGFRQLFHAGVLGNNWEDVMAKAVAAASSLAEDVIVFTRRMNDRNLVVRIAGHITLHENTRWVLHISAQGIGPRHIRCVYHRRNLSERWTTRYDWRLPSTNDGARYPFRPRDMWWKPSTSVFGTVSARPAWLDAHNNGWARPNIPNGAGYHWDVFLRCRAHQEKIGVNQINVVEYGAPSTEGRCGDLHHVPDDQAGRVRDAGWTC